MFERFTTPARMVVVNAQEQARRLGDRRIDAEHLLLAVSLSPDPTTAVLHEHGLTPAGIEATIRSRRSRSTFRDVDEQALAAIGIDLDQVRAHVENALGAHAHPTERTRRGPFRRFSFGAGHLPFSRSAKACLEGALRECLAARDSHLGVEHLALALVGGNAPAVRAALADAGVSPQSLRTVIQERYRQAG